jgi:hypothetical protein
MEARETINIISSQVSPRLHYVLSFLSEQLGIDFIFNNTPDDRTLYYGSTVTEGAVCIYDSGLLWEKSVSKKEIPVSAIPGNVQLFPSPIGFDFPFDILSAIFYMLSRYEEYLPFEPDEHGRFEVSQSLAGKYGFTEEPVVDGWINLLRTYLLQQFPGIQIQRRQFEFASTFDVDSPWAFLHKSLLRTAGGFARSLYSFDFEAISNRISVLLKKKKDPFDVYDYISQLEEEYSFRSTYFFLSGDYGGNDVNVAFRKPVFKDLITKIGTHNRIGIHPSYRSNKDVRILANEIEEFSGILGIKPDESRQHFLILKIPETYRNLISSGIKDDYSMGYASSVGFRAGTTLPFRFYDLGFEKETSLKIHSFAAMDVTLQRYMNLNPIQASEKIRQLVHKTAAVNGVFTWLWHNESLSDKGQWKGWRVVFEEMIAECGKVTGNW